MFTSSSTGSLTPRLSECFPRDSLKTSFVLGVPLGSPKTRDVPTGSQIARVRERASLGAEVEVRAEESWRMTRSDRDIP
ncbi:hypothetical protein E5676_scaffold233G00250 [Cucumis melo var. makuwa]|uniref:Uncharacterized protein n=1 Tax=Cucumis melo var. makuwa TaxID=1194695 RepID=A0A5D3BCW4_CUCMM|nr:hypothetical protein E6C27_scaffold38G00260 [Cucumis melo var. makuwa]TYJ96806.1 hypothetical protein E5676_scaffold233G00250 [Cucumis melo var. makuwa]